ncbi:MAG: hypothetical protein AB2L20_30655 [Mangrovibacterium sp.]
MRTTSKIPVWHQLFTAVLLVIIGMILLTLPSVNMNPLMNSTQSGENDLFYIPDDGGGKYPAFTYGILLKYQVNQN